MSNSKWVSDGKGKEEYVLEISSENKLELINFSDESGYVIGYDLFPLIKGGE